MFIHLHILKNEWNRNLIIKGQKLIWNFLWRFALASFVRCTFSSTRWSPSVFFLSRAYIRLFWPDTCLSVLPVPSSSLFSCWYFFASEIGFRPLVNRVVFSWFILIPRFVWIFDEPLLPSTRAAKFWKLTVFEGFVSSPTFRSCRDLCLRGFYSDECWVDFPVLLIVL